MARTYSDRLEDKDILSELQIGTKVRFLSKKKNCNKTGIVTGFNTYDSEYSKKYGCRYRMKRYNYTSVTIQLDDNGKRITVSPRNLVVI